MNLLTITDKFLKDREHQSDNTFGMEIRRLCKEKASTNPESLYQKFMDIYNDFHLDKLGVPAKIDGTQGKALNEIIKYISSVSKDKTEDGTTASWKYICTKENWNKMHDSLKNKMRLIDINSNLTNILNQLRNGKQPAKTITESATSISEWDGN